ncbi:unnamed protein product [Rotaria magnacalcarata]|nr:unnamed protein product [Rotaria magnacalcarata]
MLVGLIPDIMKYVSVAKDKCNANADPLTRDESAAIYLYTMPKCVFRLLNNALRTQDRHKIAPWLSYLKLFIGALKKLPSCNGTVWRGASLDDGIIFTDGDIHTWWTVNSCSTDLQIIELYLGDKGTVFAIDAIEAKNISAFSAFPVERELILMPGTRVWPLSKKLNFKDQYFLVHLKEEDKQSASTADTHSPLEKLFQAIRVKYLRDNSIQYILNEEQSFPLWQSYITLAIVESSEQLKSEKKLKEQEENNRPTRDGSNYYTKYHHSEMIGAYEEFYDDKILIHPEDIVNRCTNPTKSVLVLGQAGVGKSTFCRYVSYQWAKEKLWREYDLLILISLRSLTSSRYPPGKEYSPIDVIQTEYSLFEDMSQNDKQYFDDMCNNGQVLWILDGYNEVVYQMPNQLKEFFAYVSKTQHHILTSRPYAVTLSYDVKLEITGFTNDNIINYVEHFFDLMKEDIGDARGKTESLINFLKLNSNVFGIAHIPVNLEFICSLWIDNDCSDMKQLTVTKLYDKIVEWQCRRHLTRRTIFHRLKNKEEVYLICETELQFLETLAFKAIEANQIILTSTLFKETERETGFPLSGNPQIFNIGILKPYDDKPTGTRAQPDIQHYFVHLSFQEHFAARYLLKTLQNSNKQKAIDFIRENKYNLRFLPVFVFAAGLLNQSDYFPCIDIFWSTLQAEPLDLLGLQHTKIMIRCIDEFEHDVDFTQRDTVFKSYCFWLDVYAKSEVRVIRENIQHLVSPRRSLLNHPILEEKFIEFLRSNNKSKKLRTLELLSQMSVLNPTRKLVSEILLALQDEDLHISSIAAVALRNINETVVTDDIANVLVRMLQDKSSHIRCQACKIVGKISTNAITNEVIQYVVESINDQEAEVRCEVIKALGQIGETKPTDKIINGLTNALRNKDSDVRYHACKALGRIGESTPTDKMIHCLIEALHDPDSKLQREASQALGKIGEKRETDKIISRLMSVLQHEDVNVRCEVLISIGRIGENATTDEVVKCIIESLNDQDPKVQLEASKTLGKIGAKKATNKIISSLVNTLKHSNPLVRYEACVGLGAMREKAAVTEVVDGLLQLFRDKNPRVKFQACDTLAKISEKAAVHDLTSRLISLLEDQDWNVRRAVCMMLRKIRSKIATKEVITSLINALGDKKSDVGQQASKALAKICENTMINEIIADFVSAFMNKNSSIRAGVCATLGRIGSKAATNHVIDGLIRMIEDEDSWVNLRACEALVKFGRDTTTNRVIDGLIKALQHRDLGIRKGACSVLEKISEHVVTDQLIKGILDAIDDKDSYVSWKVCVVLGKIAAKSATSNAITNLIDALRHGNYVMQKEATEALINIASHGKTNEVIIHLSRVCHDDEEDDMVKIRAFDALGEIGKDVTTNEIIIALIDAVTQEEMAIVDCAVLEALDRAISSYHAISQLKPTMLSRLLGFMKKGKLELKSVPSDHFLKLFLETRNLDLAPLVAYAAVIQGTAITLIEDHITVYDSKGISRFPVTDHNLKLTLVGAFASIKTELGS